MVRQDTTCNRSQEVGTIPKEDVASNVSSAASVSMGSIRKFFAESTRMAGPLSLAESPVDHPIELDATGLPLDCLLYTSPSPRDS